MKTLTNLTERFINYLDNSKFFTIVISFIFYLLESVFKRF